MKANIFISTIPGCHIRITDAESKQNYLELCNLLVHSVIGNIKTTTETGRLKLGLCYVSAEDVTWLSVERII